MNIKQIVDKIAVEGGFNTSEYSLNNRIDDVNASYFKHIEIARQIGSTQPITDAGEVKVVDNIALTAGNTTYTRTIPDVAIRRVDFKPTGSSRYHRLDIDYSVSVDTYDNWCRRYFADEKYIYIEDLKQDGEMRVTYEGGTVAGFTLANYNAGTPPSPTFLPEVFHPLLWLEPAMNKTALYNNNRHASLKNQYESLYVLFYKHYKRLASKNFKVVTKTMYESGTNLGSRRCR